MDMIFIDFYRFYFNRSKPDNLHKSSFWEINEYSIEDRRLALSRLDLWLSINKKNNDKNINYKSKTTFILEKLSNNKTNNSFEEIYTIFNVKKYLSEDFKSKNIKKIFLNDYIIFSDILQKKYIEEKNIQYFNTSLKLVDFLIYCQINSKNERINGAIPLFFPNKNWFTDIDYNINLYFRKILFNQIEIIEYLNNEK